MHNEGVSLQVFDSPALTRAARSIRASGLFRPREKRWITLPVVERMLEWAKENRGYNTFVALFAISYIFLLRLPSEALPMRIGPVDDDSSQSVLEYRDDKLVLNLKRRKNRPLGGTLTRDCWCTFSPKCCPIHVFGRSLSKIKKGTCMFSNITTARALTTLRFILEQIGVEGAREYRTHDLRRGHVLDLQKAGMPSY